MDQNSAVKNREDQHDKDWESKLLPGEQPLLVFISSVITTELEPIRDRVISSIQQFNEFIPWTFEHTPASSEPVDQGYLRKVREADFVIWLIGEETTIPVENEVREAIANNRSLLAFKLPVDHGRDKKTRNLINEIGNYTKWKDIKKIDDLFKSLELALTDELIRAVRNKPRLNRIFKINELQNSSRARCLARWQATGISLKKAIELYEDPTIGIPSMELIAKLSKEKLVIITGDFGSGKSFIADRLLQASIKEWVEKVNSSVPLFVKASDIKEDLEKMILDLSSDYGNPRVNGAFIVIDGADETTLSISNELLNSSRILVQTWQNTTIVITSRSLPVFSNIEEEIKIDLLNNQDIINLINRVFNINVTQGLIARAPEPIRESIKRPFFALIWGKYLSCNQNGQVKTTGELIDYFIENILRAHKGYKSKINKLFRKVGIKSIENRGSYIPWREIGTYEEINSLLETRLVEDVDEKVGFPLPIIAQWFAANGLVRNEISIRDICDDLMRLDNWLYPLILVVSLFPYDDVVKIMGPVIKANPGLASEIIKEGVADNLFGDDILLPSAKICGKRIREIYELWTDGFGEITKFIAPIDEEGNLCPIGVSTYENKIMVAWYSGEEKINNLNEFPIGVFKNKNNGWDGAIMSTAGHQPAWIIKWVLDELKDGFKKVVDRKSFVLPNGYIYKEKMWVCALKEMSLSSSYNRSIDLAELKSKIIEREKQNNLDGNSEWNELSIYINRQMEMGETFLNPLWTKGDLTNNSGYWIIKPYSDNQILEQAINIYLAALEEYENLINWLFGNIRSRMLIATLLPVRMHGFIKFSDSSIGGRTPWLNWYFEPLPFGYKNEVDFELVDKKNKQIDVHDLWKLNRKMRPKSVEWISAFTSGTFLDIFNESPVTNIVYKWLKNDLQEINLV